MKKDLIKVGLISGIVGSILCGGIGSVVAYNMGANQIEYTPKNSGWKVNSVSEAIDSLYISKAGENYSTSEQVVGTWTDGRPVYQKTLNIGALTNSTNAWSSKLVDTGVSISEIVNMSVIMIDNTNTVIEGSYHDGGSTVTFNVGYPNSHTNASNRNKVGIRYAGDLSWITDSYVTVQYTKTTDTVPNQNQEG